MSPWCLLSFSLTEPWFLLMKKYINWTITSNYRNTSENGVWIWIFESVSQWVSESVLFQKLPSLEVFFINMYFQTRWGLFKQCTCDCNLFTVTNGQHRILCHCCSCIILNTYIDILQNPCVALNIAVLITPCGQPFIHLVYLNMNISLWNLLED